LAAIVKKWGYFTIKHCSKQPQKFTNIQNFKKLSKPSWGKMPENQFHALKTGKAFEKLATLP